MASVTVKTDDAERRDRAFVEAFTGAPARILREGLADAYRTAAAEAFARKATPDGSPWAPQAVPRPWSLLDRTGGLKSAVKVTTKKSGASFTVTGTVAGGADSRGVPYARIAGALYHGRKKRAPTPARYWFGTTSRMVEEFRALADRVVLEARDKPGRS